jgi:hypothetical protein
MAQAELVQAYDDRRKDVRITKTVPTRLLLVGGVNWQPCAIVDESRSGAQIEFGQALDVAGDVTVEMGAGDVRLAKIRWFRGTRAGLEFYNIPPAVAAAAAIDECMISIKPYEIQGGMMRLLFIQQDGRRLNDFDCTKPAILYFRLSEVTKTWSAVDEFGQPY